MPAALALVTAVVLAGLFVIPAMAPASAAASPAWSAPSAANGELQANGNVTHLSFQGQTSRGEYFGNVTYGFVVNVTETNTSANVSEVQVEETVGIAFYLTYCQPNCARPAVTLTDSYVASETRDVWANLTDQANVTATVNGTTAVVPAIGLIDSATRTHASVAESAVATVYPNGTNSTRVYSVSLNAQYEANSSVAFTPALGLFPSGSLVPGETWSSTAAFLLNGMWNATWSIQVSTPHSSSELNGTAGRTLGPIAGTVTLVGSAEPVWSHVGPNATVTVAYRWSVSDLVFAGPFAVGTPDLPSFWQGNFGGNWQLYEAARGQVGFNAFEMSSHPGRQGAVAATTVTFSVGVTDSTGQTATNQSDLSPSTLAGAPMSSAQASSTSACLQAGNCAASPSGGSSLGLNGLVLVLVALVVVVAAAVLAAVAYSRRGRAPPPSPPNVA